jgi:hypothetical protein
MNEECSMKYRGAHRYLSEMMNNLTPVNEVAAPSSVTSLLKKAFYSAIPADKLSIGSKGDIIVISTMPAARRVEIDIHHSHIVTEADDCYEIRTSGGLRLPSSWRDDLVETQVLFVENIGEVDSQLTWLRLQVQPDWNGWEFSIQTDEPSTLAEGTESKPVKPFSQVKQYPLDALLTGYGSGTELKHTPEYRRDKQVNSYRASMADRVKDGYSDADEDDWDN